MEVYLQYGVLGMSVIALARYVMYLHKEQKIERREWRNSYDKNTEATNRKSNIIAELKSVLESIDRRS